MNVTLKGKNAKGEPTSDVIVYDSDYDLHTPDHLAGLLARAFERVVVNFLVSNRVSGDGTKHRYTYTANYDGKDNPVTGSPLIDTQ